MSSSEWTEELKTEVIEAYKEQNPTEETTLEIVKDLAEKYEKSVNGIRMVLSRGGVYVKKTSTTSTTTSTGAKRVNKTEAIENLKQAISALNKDVDDDICDRLTGKAAVYFTNILKA
jgi:hypothetical protein